MLNLANGMFLSLIICNIEVDRYLLMSTLTVCFVGKKPQKEYKPGKKKTRSKDTIQH
jgi:hypothetical protein